MCCRGRQGREMEKEKWYGITKEYNINSTEISRSKSTKRKALRFHNLNLPLKKMEQVLYLFIFLNQSANMTVYLTPREQGRDLDNKTGRDREVYG